MCLSHFRFFGDINRGGLIPPTDVAYALAVKCFSLFCHIKGEAELKGLFLRGGGQRDAFLHLVLAALEEDAALADVTARNSQCEHGHNVLESLIVRFFNCMLKNFVKEETERICDRDLQNRRKKVKLNGSSALA